MTAPADAVAAFHPARLAARADAGGGLSLLTLEAAYTLTATYVSPGQYIEVRVAGETGYFVLANEPGARRWELILRSGGGASDVLLAMQVGAHIEVTGAIGEGFPMAEARARPLVIALSGTGIAAARPLVRRRIADGDADRTDLLVGVRTRRELPIERELDAWADAGLNVVVCLSQVEEPLGEGRFQRGYVQDVLRSRAELRAATATATAAAAAAGTGGGGGARIFAVGVASMVDALRELAPALGIAPEHVHTNH